MLARVLTLANFCSRDALSFLGLKAFFIQARHVLGPTSVVSSIAQQKHGDIPHITPSTPSVVLDRVQ
jgi:hypothetical protein